jgi:hypothetical protein
MKVKCEVCGNLGQLQHLSKNYYRVKHYLGSVDGKLKFEYHKQSFQYVQGILRQNKTCSIDQIDPKTIDPRLKGNSLFLQNMAGGVGFAPQINWRRLPNLSLFL